MAETDQQRRKLKRLEEQERKIAFSDFSHADAWRLGTILDRRLELSVTPG